ncbi:mannose-1-phosphate guanylyltransferase/mannose-6-phosphate isomerase [Pseudoalteromonas denitrificans]|uniref:mannose-1-phosphate guanylyltransferase n=1 Tax=Pseudoalteromonas denitrificans DSM 6059 TaxID=1123010 RepID=A0A1I1V216_9GAMM|nr:mannose-1-phosphate guanylyltransferase/mannose-6-phosphate isomerase [Pseudoalteromonas denitrificans]SFD75113.1 mannose-1-phosphate guanylyltransferase (GDP) /mannose-6-phosphate isomerase, type 2 [Pseudoalteromonas denitrificans DSM 6059]
MILPVIMSGGSGSRLWPLSRALHPKQFLALLNENTLLQETINRLDPASTIDPLIICNNEHRFIVAEQLRANGTGSSDIILEPMGKNTAPAITLAALAAIAKGDDPLLLVLAADHVIKDVTAFQTAVVTASDFAEQGKLVTFGIVPTHAETGYGYIKQGEKRTQLESVGFDVASFVEKPDLTTAQSYLDSGEYLWNSGMFMFKASRYLEELAKFSPKMLEVCTKAYESKSQDLDFTRICADIFAQCPEDSIDYAVMEPLCKAEDSQNAIVVPMNAGWSDVGSFSSLWEVSEKDESGNVNHGDIISHNTTNSYINAGHKLVTTVGIDNLVIVETKDALLVADKSQVQDVKKIVEKLKSDERYEYKHQREVYRPWGKYDSLDFGDRDQVKRITVKPGAKLSVQMHHHRSEHWVVVSGTAKVTNGDKTFLVTENESTYIPLGQVHALENPGVLPLELIEVQTGSYLGEDDIVRFDDKYGRG